MGLAQFRVSEFGRSRQDQNVDLRFIELGFQDKYGDVEGEDVQFWIFVSEFNIYLKENGKQYDRFYLF